MLEIALLVAGILCYQFGHLILATLFFFPVIFTFYNGSKSLKETFYMPIKQSFCKHNWEVTDIVRIEQYKPNGQEPYKESKTTTSTCKNCNDQKVVKTGGSW